jgi:hypothetical protein
MFLQGLFNSGHIRLLLSNQHHAIACMGQLISDNWEMEGPSPYFDDCDDDV